MPITSVRQYYKQHAIPSLPGIQFKDLKVDNTGLRLHYPPCLGADKSYPVVIYFRASAYIFGEISDSDTFCHLLANELNCVVAAIETRLAPECKFPGHFEDALKGVLYLHEHASDFQIDKGRFCFWGESSGGNLAAALSQELSGPSHSIIRHQVLFYPMLDYSKLYPSSELYGEGYLMDRALCDWLLVQFTNNVEDVYDPRFSPLLGHKHKSHPSTLIVGAQYDPMIDESFAYIDELVKADISVEAYFIPGLIHGFLWYTQAIEPAFAAQRFAVENLRKKL